MNYRVLSLNPLLPSNKIQVSVSIYLESMTLKWREFSPSEDPKGKKGLGSFWDPSGSGCQLRSRSHGLGLVAACEEWRLDWTLSTGGTNLKALDPAEAWQTPLSWASSSVSRPSPRGDRKHKAADVNLYSRVSHGKPHLCILETPAVYKGGT